MRPATTDTTDIMKSLIALFIATMAIVSTSYSQCEHCSAAGESSAKDSDSSHHLTSYFEIQKALANDDFKAAKKVAATLNKESESCSLAGHDCCATIRESTAAIAKAIDIKSARASFKNFSDTLTAKLESEEAASDPVYKIHCPMAFGNTGGTWLQDNEDLRNPYYGSMMLKCGMQQAVISKK